MSSPLNDLDELTLLCRDEKAKLYIAEAVSSYRAGAFRSTIVSSWVAVCFDIIDKIRELSLAGDKEAELQVKNLENIRVSGDITNALKFERTILVLARDKFELISPLEYIDLERLQSDRNRCAHPSLIADNKAYSPPAELARLHIYSAVTHLLQHPPVQGKHALERLMKEIESEYFPSSSMEARTFFESGPLRRPRETLVRNLVVVVVKILVKEKPEYQRRRRLVSALLAVRLLHPNPSNNCLQEVISKTFKILDDADLLGAINFLADVSDTWQYLANDVQQRLQNFVKDLPKSYFDEFSFLLTYAPLQSFAKSRLGKATRQELDETLFFDLPAEVADKYISLYLGSITFEAANELAKRISIYIDDLTKTQVETILKGAAKNPQITESFQIRGLITKLRSAKLFETEEFERLLTSNGLIEFLE